MNMRKRITFIVNPISGTTKKAGVPELIEKYLDHELFDYKIRMTEYAGHAEIISEEEKAQHTDIVVAVGGDGTVNEGQMLRTHALFLGRTTADAGVFGLEGCGRQEHRRCGRNKNSFRIHM